MAGSTTVDFLDFVWAAATGVCDGGPVGNTDSWDGCGALELGKVISLGEFQGPSCLAFWVIDKVVAGERIMVCGGGGGGRDLTDLGYGRLGPVRWPDGLLGVDIIVYLKLHA